MKNVLQTSDIFNNPSDWQNHYTKCEKVKSDLVLYSKDLLFLQQLLDTYFDEMVKNEHLDEIRESLIRFQDLCYDCDRLKKRVKDQQSHLIEIIKGASPHDHNAILIEQSGIENRNARIVKELKMVKKEILLISENVLQEKKDDESIVHRT
jgi:hypothetical protein